jgi:hypothetical protein
MSYRFCASILALSFAAGCGGAAASTSAPVAPPPGGAAAASVVAGTRFTKKQPGVGTVTVTHEHNETRLEMDITVDGSAQHTSSVIAETIERRAEVLAVGADGAPTKLRVAYAVNRKEETGKPLVASPLEGKTYVLEGHGAKLPSVTDAAGNPAPEAEAPVVANDFKHLGRVDPSWRALPERPVVVGDSMDDMAKAVLDDQTDEGLEKVQVHYEGEHDVGGRPAGVFGVELTGTVNKGMRVAMKGKVALLVASGLEAESDAEGPIELSQHETRNGKDISVVAHGTIHIHKETSFAGR